MMYETLLTKAIFNVLDYALNRHACVLIQGRTGRGKTEAAAAWVRDNRRDAYYIDCPVDGGIPAISAAIAAAIGASSVDEMVTLLAKRRAILVLDECARLIPVHGERARALEYLRRLHDQTGVALAFVATDFFMRECTASGLSGYLEQFIGRFHDKLIIPDYVSDAECTDILRPFLAAAPAPDLVKFAARVANDTGRGGARRLWWLLEDAKAVADRTSKPLDLPFLRAALADYEGRDRLPQPAAAK